MTDAKFALFLVCAVFAVAGAVGTVLSARPLRAAMALLVLILSLAGLFLTLSAQLLGTVQLLVYAGAIVILFVFVIMLIGPGGDSVGAAKSVIPRMLSAIGVTILTAGMFVVGGVAKVWPALPNHFGDVEGVGIPLFTEAVVPFELVSLTLTVAIVGAMAIARKKTAAEIANLNAESSQPAE